MHEKRIARGAAWLDKHEPDWYKNIKVEILDPSSHRNCVIGQVFGRYDEYMCRRYFVPPSWGWLAVLHPGFWAANRFSASHGFLALQETTYQWRRAWAAEITKRRVAEIRGRKIAARKDAVLYVPVEWSARSRELEEHLLRG